MNTPKDVEDICKKLKPVIGSQAEKLWYMYLAEDETGRRDMNLDIEIIAEKALKKDALIKQEILLEPPSEIDSAGSFFLGDVIYNRKYLHPLFLQHNDFTKQIGIFSITGEGKTNLAYLLALQLLKSKIPFIVIDWKRSWRNLLSLRDKIPELKNVQIYTVGREILPFLWNPFRPPPGSNKELWISTISEVLEKSHLSGPGVAYHFNSIYPKIFKNLKNNGFYPNFYDGLHAIKNVRVSGREFLWKQTAMRIFQNFTLGSASKVFNTRNPIKIEELLNKPIILELDLEMPKPLRTFCSEMILRWIHLYRLSQGETEKLRHVLFLEEVHNLFTETGFYKTTNCLENVYREIRAFGQGIVSITQHPSLLPIYLLGNCHTQIYLGLQHADDIRTARKALFLKHDEEHYLNMLKIGECIVKIKNRVDPCLVKIPLVPVQKGAITDDWLRENTPGYLPNIPVGGASNKPRYLPQYEYRDDLKGKPLKNNNNREFMILIDIFENPLASTTERYKRLKLNPKYGNKFKNMLISKGYVQPRKIITGKGWITLYDLTHKGKMLLRDMGHDINGLREGIVHKFWKYKIAEYYKNQGLKVLIEESINGKPDIIVFNHNKKAAVEIETGKSDVIGNIQKALEADFDEIICVATDKTVEGKIRRDLERKNIFDERVKITNVFGYGV